VRVSGCVRVACVCVCVLIIVMLHVGTCRVRCVCIIKISKIFRSMFAYANFFV
jgi:hypothetical protein